MLGLPHLAKLAIKCAGMEACDSEEDYQPGNMLLEALAAGLR